MQHLKKVFCLLLLFYLLFHFALPICYYLIYGYSPTYQRELFDLDSMMKGVWLNVASVLLAIVLISITKLKMTYKKILNTRSVLYFLIALLITVCDFILAPSFADKIMGINGGNVIIILCSLVFNVESYLLFSFVSSRSFMPSSGLFYVFIKLILASRSAPLTLVNVFICSMASMNFKRFWKKFAVVVFVSVLLSFQGFKWASLIREKSFSKGYTFTLPMSEESQIAQDNKSVVTRIIGRVSFLENTMLPIYYKDFLKINQSNNIFYDKYALDNQLKILVNNLIPGDFFEFDVYPNQYYRSAFLKVSPDLSKQHYASINITLPVYFYMFLGEFFGILIAGISIWLYFIITVYLAKIQPLFGFVFLAALVGNFLAFFDLVMLIKMNIFGLFSAIVFLLTSKLARLVPKRGVFKWLRY